MIGLTPIANGLFLEWDGMIDTEIDSGFDPLGHQWDFIFDKWIIDEETWQPDDWVTDFHIEFSGLTPGNQIFVSSFIVTKQGQDIPWNGVVDGPIDAGVDPLGHQWFMNFNELGMQEDMWLGDEPVTDIHIKFNGLTSSNLVIDGDFFVTKPDGSVHEWNCQTTDTEYECQAVDPINDRLNPGDEFNGGAFFQDEPPQSFSFDATWTRDGVQQEVPWDCKVVDEIKMWCVAVGPINDRLNPGDEFTTFALFNQEQNPSITFNAEWTMDVNGDDEVVGGELIPIQTTSLLLAGVQSFSWMIPVVLSVLGIGLFVVSRKSE